MKPLPTQLDYKDFTYRQVARDGMVAVYSQSFKGENAPFAYEVIIVQSHNGYSMMGNEVAPSEFYPKDEDWGKKAWTISGHGERNRRFALDKMRQVMDDMVMKQDKKSRKAKTT